MLIGEYGEDDEEYSYGPYTLVDLKTGESRPVEDNSRSTSIYGVSVDNDGNLYGNSEHDLMFRTWHACRQVLVRLPQRSPSGLWRGLERRVRQDF